MRKVPRDTHRHGSGDSERERDDSDEADCAYDKSKMEGRLPKRLDHFQEVAPHQEGWRGDIGEKWGWRCTLCGIYYRDILRDSLFTCHEILHLLQQMRGHYSNDYFAPIFDGEPEEKSK